MQKSNPSDATPESSELSLTLQWHMLDNTIGDVKTILVGVSFMVMVASLAQFGQGDARWLVPWAAAAVAVLVARLALLRAYRRRSPDDRPSVWAWRFTYGSWVTAAFWGGAGAVVMLGDNDFARFLVITVESGFLIGAAVRTSAIPQAATGQIYIVLCPVMVAALLCGRLEYQLYGGLVVVHILSARAVARGLCERAKQLMSTEEAMIETCARLAEANARLSSLALTDGLTGILNRRGLDEALEREWRRARRAHGYVSLVLFDIDHFKLLNDTQGHMVGDECLRHVARCLHDNVQRPADLVARFGGEEFAVLLGDTDHFGALQAAERLRRAVEAEMLAHPASPFGVITVSGGTVTTLTDDRTPAEMLRDADAALYAAKASGRNKVRSIDGGTPERERADLAA